MCWKWPPFASRQDWTRRAIFWEVLASTSAVTTWISSVSLLSWRLWFVVCFGKLFLSDIPIRNNQAATDLSSAEAKFPSKWSGRRKIPHQTPISSEWRGASCTDIFLFISHTTNVLLFKFHCNIFIGVIIIKKMPVSVASETHCTKCLGLKMRFSVLYESRKEKRKQQLKKD